MADDPFYYHLKSALDHFWAAIHDLNVALGMPPYKLLPPNDRKQLRLAHGYWADKIRAISEILPRAVVATSRQDAASQWAQAALDKLKQPIDTTKSDNAEPPGPE